MEWDTKLQVGAMPSRDRNAELLSEPSVGAEPAAPPCTPTTEMRYDEQLNTAASP